MNASGAKPLSGFSTNTDCGVPIMHQPKLLASLALLSLPVFSPACGTEFEDCTATRTCTRGGAAGSAGSGGAAGSGGMAGSTGSAGTAGATSAGSTGTGGSAGGLGMSGEGGEQAGVGGASTGGSSGGGLGGTAGSSTDAGEGGEAGAPEPVACERDENCDDGLFCDGIETCEEGVCQEAASPPCANPDAAHCRSSCEEGDGEASCVVEALDEDEDGHGAAQCERAPGDDCDDENAQIHPDAQEACDGLDNDCDELVDLDDGLELAGETRSVDGIYSLDMAWIPGAPGVQEDEQFRVAFSEVDVRGIRSAVLEGSGALGQEVSQLTTTTANAHSFPRLAAGTTTFGLTYANSGRGSAAFSAIQADSNGTPSGDRNIEEDRYTAGGELSGGSADIARRARGEWVIGINESQGVRVARYLDNGSIESGPLLTTSGQPTSWPSWVRIAAQGDASAVVWQVAPDLLHWARLNSNLVAMDGVRLGATGYRPDIVAAGTGYALAWATGSGIGFMRAGTDGTKVCEKGLVPLGLEEASDSHRVALAHSELGTLALVTSAAGKVVLVRFGADCEASAIAPVANTVTADSPAIAVGNGSVALAWIHKRNSMAYTRLVGEHLCE
jgi:hypothetical protein